MTATALARARRIPVCVPAGPGGTRGSQRAASADLLDPGYPDEVAWQDFYTLQAARRRAQQVGSRGAHVVAVCARAGERLFADRNRLLRLLISERVGRPAATVASVLDELTRRMAEFEQTEDYEDTDPVQALRMVAGGMLAELDAVNDPDVIGAWSVPGGDGSRG